MKMKTYSVSFYRRDEQGKEHFLGQNTVDMKENDEMCLQTKAFRQATPEQQIATKTRIKLLKVWGLIFAAFMVQSCATAPAPAPVEMPAEQPAFDYKVADTKFKAEWAVTVLSSLDQDGKNLLAALPKDALDFCPSFTKLSLQGRKQFWLMLISELVRYESNYKPEVTYTEDFDDAKGNAVISRGLLQISQESANGKAYQCGIKKAEDLHEPNLNLWCGVKIMDYWARKDAYISKKEGDTWKGIGARYWGPMRKANRLASIAAKTKAVCQ